ncbi:mucin-5AC [Adelges cooleyi]|uniref:mucin-5AC n=1 Tax=Adelges cooleyi TaxID=133065 RepID=UPI00217F78D1|nr:mucin-5AC [Adelges cooleyi]
MGTGTRWLVTLCLLAAVECVPSRITHQSETDSEDSRKVLGSSVVTSVSVIMDHGNGTKTYFADGQSKNVHRPSETIVGSPGNLLSPDRYEFYTFDETGDLVKRLMTLDEIHGLIAGADPESVMADASPTYYHDALSSHSSEALMHLPATDLESLDAPAVHKVLESVQNVLKNEMAANSGKPLAPIPVIPLHHSETASAWSALFPGLIETPDDVAHLSGYLLPSKVAESASKPPLKKPLATTKQPVVTTTMARLPTTTTSTTEKFKFTPPKSTTTAKSPELTPLFTSTFKPTTAAAKKPFRPVQSFDKQKPTAPNPTLVLKPTDKPSPHVADKLDINKEMSASLSDMLSQVTDSQSANNNPIQNNALVEKDNTADYIPEESSPELSYYSPVALSLTSPTTPKPTPAPVAEALTTVKKHHSTAATFKSTTTEMPPLQKTVSTSTMTKFGPSKFNNTKLRPPTNFTISSVVTKAPPPSFNNKFNGSTYAATTVSSTRNNYHYPPSNMSTKYMQKITQTTPQAYPSNAINSFVKLVNKTINNNGTFNIKQPNDTIWNATEELKNKFKEPNKVFSNKVITSTRPNIINRTNVTLSNRIQELKTTTTTTPLYGSATYTTTVRNMTQPEQYISVKVDSWPTTPPQSIFATSNAYMSSTPKAYMPSSGQPFNSFTDSNTIRELISSLMTTPTTSSPSNVVITSTTTGADQLLTPVASTTVATFLKNATGNPAALSSSTTETPTTVTTTSTAATSTTTPSTTTSSAATPSAATSSSSTSSSSTSSASSSSTASLSTTSSSTTLSSTTLSSTTSSPTSEATTTTSTAINSVGNSVTNSTTETVALLVTSTTPESETQYVPVTHFLPELQVKDKPEAEHPNNSAPGVDPLLKDGISAVANMLQNTQKPSILSTEYLPVNTRPYEKFVTAGVAKQTSTEQARRQSTIKTDIDDISTTTIDNLTTQEPYEFTTAESTTRFSESTNDTVAMESATINDKEDISRISEPGLDMLTVFNVSSTGIPVQAAKLADLSAETQITFDTTGTTPFDNHITDPATTTEEVVTTARAVTTPSTTTTEVTQSPTKQSIVVTSNAPENSTTFTLVATTTLSNHKSPIVSSNAYRPLSNSASPSTVELHPAPHESMGLEASVAFLGDDVRRFADLCNELSFKMWTAVTGKGQIASRSLVLSPFELTAMLAMVFLGARGSTSGQMNDVLRLDDMVTFNPHQVLRNVTQSITNANNPGVATASFVREIYSHKGNGKILDFYKERVQQYYDGHVEEVDFNTIGDVLRRRTNLLVKRQTLGRVVEYLRGSGLSLTPPFAAFSANVFQTSCESASTEGRDGEMYFVVRPSTRQRRLVPVPAAVWRSGFLAGYEPGLDATAVSLSPDSVISTILILPGQQGQVAPGDGLTRLEQRLIETSYRRGGWSRILRSLLPRPGLELQIPRFSHRSVLNTTAALQKMGLKDVFSEQKADLRGVNGLYDLYLSDMLQVNTFSTCGEDVIGARHHVETYPASPQRMGRADGMPSSEQERRRKRYAHEAAEELLRNPYSHLPLNLRPRQARLPDVPRLRFDRPFLYLVRHNPTGMIVYLGRFNPRLLP